MSEMKSLTLNGKKYDCFVDSVARSKLESAMVIGSESGETIAVSDASNYNPIGLRIFGKTTQNGTPTPDAPVALDSAGDSGSVTVRVSGKNLLYTNDLILLKSNGCTETKTATSIIATNTTGGESSYLLYRWLPISALDGKKITVSLKIKADNGVPPGILIGYANADGSIRSNIDINQPTGNAFTCTYIVDSNSERAKDCEYICFWFYSRSLGSVEYYDIQIELGPTATEYERYKGETVTVPTPNGLPGIPVTSGGNYTDANGQQWVCDEIDLAKGVYEQRTVLLENFTARVSHANTDQYVTELSAKMLGRSTPKALCTVVDKSLYAYNTSDNLHFYVDNYSACVFVPTGFDNSGNVIKVLAVLETPIETPLSEEELAAYASLHTYRDNTTVSNDAGAWMELEYVMDAKKYIDSLVKAPPAVLSNVTLLASKWAGSNGLYSQVVTIPGITEYSKVDLLPSVEQLAIFYNKNVAFVTENEDGVVTVYAIGDKPANDYTMQVQITEVVV